MKKYLIYIHVIAIYFGMLYLYGVVCEYFYYWGFSFDLDLIRMIMSLITITILIVFVKHKNDNIINAFMLYWYLFIFLPISVLFSASLINGYHYFLHVCFFSVLGILFNFNKSLIFPDKYIKPIPFVGNKRFVLLFSLLLSIPLMEIFINFNILSFNLYDVYDIRESARESGNKVIGYLKESLSRVIYPFFMIYGFIKRNIFWFLLGFIAIILVFASTGALKSVLAVIPISFLFIRLSNYILVQNRLLILTYCLVFLPIIETLFFGTIFLTDLPSRRLFFVPGLVENAFFIEYGDNPQFYLNSILKFLNENPVSLTKNIGAKYFNRPDMNANIGVLIGGFTNLGFIGVVLHAVIIYLSIAILNGLKISSKYFGIFFVYFYYMNTSFIGTLFLTHGMLFLLIFFYFIKTENESSTYLSKL